MNTRQNIRTLRYMELSRGLILGRIWTNIRHFVIGSIAITLSMMAATGHVGAAIGIAVGIYLFSKACGYLGRKLHATH